MALGSLGRALARLWSLAFSWDMLQLVRRAEARPLPLPLRPTDFPGFAAAYLRAAPTGFATGRAWLASRLWLFTR